MEKCTKQIDEILGSITSYCKDLPNVLVPPIELDAVSSKWTEEDKEGKSPNCSDTICINLLHISPKDAMLDISSSTAPSNVDQGRQFLKVMLNLTSC
jgi:hypothetical protein